MQVCALLAEDPAELEVSYDERGLVPTVVQDWSSGEVLTLAYMNAEALAHTQEQGETEERRVGKECMVQCRSRWSPYH